MAVKETVSEILYEAVARDALMSVLPVVAADYVTGEILYANALAEMLFGYGRGELLGKSVETLLPDDLKERHAEHRQAPGLARARVMGFGGPLRGKKKNGAIFPAYIGLAEKQATDRRVGVTFIIDMTGYTGDAPSTAAEKHP